MALDFSIMDSLAQALEEKFPQTDLSVLGYKALAEMLDALENNKEKELSEEEMETLINVWIGLQFPEEEEKIPSSQVE